MERLGGVERGAETAGDSGRFAQIAVHFEKLFGLV